MITTVRLLAGAGVLATLALLQAGCVTAPQPSGSASEMVTASDEPEARRRARIRLELAVGYFEQGKTEIALDEIKQVLVIDPSFPEAYDMRGVIYMRMNDNRAAEESFRRALAINPRDADAHHNLGWMMCQQGRYPEAQRSFDIVMASATYPGRARTLMAQGVCQARAGLVAEAEQSLSRSYELDPSNPVTGYNLASLLFRRGEGQRAQFYIRNLNNSDFANAESLWLGIKVERRMNDMVALRQLGEQLRKRFAGSREARAYERGTFDE